MALITRAATWTIIASVVLAILQVTQIMIAARYMTASDFGSLATALGVMSIVLTVQESSFIIHAGDLSRRGQATLFWISTAIGGGGAILLAAGSGLVSRFFELPDTRDLFLIAALNIFALAIGGHYHANLIRTFRAHHVGQVEVLVRCLSFLLTCWLLIAKGFRSEAIMIGMFAYSAGKAILMATVADKHMHPSFSFDPSLAKRVIGYNANQGGSAFMNQARYQADQLIVAKIFAPEIAGIYYLAKELISHPLRILEPLALRLTLPAFAKVQNDHRQLELMFRRAVRRAAVFGGAIYAGVAFFAVWLVEILYGVKFLSAVPFVLALVVLGLARYIGIITSALAFATGRMVEMLRWAGLGAAAFGIFLFGLAFAAPPPIVLAGVASLLQLAIALVGPAFFVPPLPQGHLPSYARLLFLGAAITLASVALSLLVKLPLLGTLIPAAVAALSSIS